MALTRILICGATGPMLGDLKALELVPHFESTTEVLKYLLKSFFVISYESPVRSCISAPLEFGLESLYQLVDAVA